MLTKSAPPNRAKRRCYGLSASAGTTRAVVDADTPEDLAEDAEMGFAYLAARAELAHYTKQTRSRAALQERVAEWVARHPSELQMPWYVCGSECHSSRVNMFGNFFFCTYHGAVHECRRGVCGHTEILVDGALRCSFTGIVLNERMAAEHRHDDEAYTAFIRPTVMRDTVSRAGEPDAADARVMTEAAARVRRIENGERPADALPEQLPLVSDAQKRLVRSNERRRLRAETPDQADAIEKECIETGDIAGAMAVRRNQSNGVLGNARQLIQQVYHWFMYRPDLRLAALSGTTAGAKRLANNAKADALRRGKKLRDATRIGVAWTWSVLRFGKEPNAETLTTPENRRHEFAAVDYIYGLYASAVAQDIIFGRDVRVPCGLAAFILVKASEVGGTVMIGDDVIWAQDSWLGRYGLDSTWLEHISRVGETSDTTAVLPGHSVSFRKLYTSGRQAFVDITMHANKDFINFLMRFDEPWSPENTTLSAEKDGAADASN